MPHVGTLDVDLGLDAEALGDGQYAHLVESLLSQGYAQRKELRRFQLVRRTADQWQQDAFGQVDAWLRALGLRTQ
jgi:hypothetical protein